MPPSRDIVIRLIGDNDSLSRTLKGSVGDLENTKRSMSDVGKTMTRTVTPAYTEIGLTMGAAGAAGAVALKQIAGAAIGFESSFAGVRKTVKGSEAELDVLGQTLRTMAKEDVPVSVNALNDIAASAGQLGIETANIEGFTSTIADLGVATNLTGEQAATSLARFANITQMPQDEFDRLGSTVVALGNNLATTESEIVDMGLRLAGAGAQIGMTEADILALSGALSSVGIESEAGGTAFSRVMVDIAQAAESGGEKLDGFADVAGMSAEDFARAFETDPARAITSFVSGLGDISDAGGNTFGVLEDLELGEVRVRDALLRASGAGDMLTESLDLSADAWAANTALTEEAAQRYATTESQMQFAKNAMVDLGIELGENLLPLISALAGGVGDLAGFFGDLPEPVQTAAVAFTTIGSAIGLIGGAALLALPRIAATQAQLATMGITAASTKTALSSTASFMTGPWGVALTAGVTALAAWKRQADRSRQATADFYQEIQDNAKLPEMEQLDETALTVQFLEQRLAAEGLQLALRETGMTVEDLARQIQAGTLERDAFGFVRVADESAAGLDPIRDAIGMVSFSVFDARTEAQRFNDVINELAPAMDRAASAAESDARGQALLADGLSGAATGMRTAGELTTWLTGETSLWARQVEVANQQVDQAVTATGDFRQALAGAGVDTQAFGQGIQSYVREPLRSLADTLTDFTVPEGAPMAQDPPPDCWTDYEAEELVTA